MFTQRTPAPGRPRTLDRNKKTLFCDAVSRGATMTEAAVTVGVSLRTVQREARSDPDFDQQLRLAYTDKPDPLVLMQSAARTHWRAAAWLLERTQPEDYGRRPASSCSPYQFEEALKVVVDAALRLAPPENHAHIYAELTAAGETAFKAIFPNYGPYGRRLVRRLPDTPLANAQRLEVLRNPPPSCIVSGGIESASHSKPPALPGDCTAASHQEAPDPFAETDLQPRALPGGRPALQEVVTPHEETPGQRPGLQVSDLAASVDRAAATHHEAVTIPDPSPTPTTPSASSESAPSSDQLPTDLPPTGAHPTDPPPANIESPPSPSAPEGRSHVARSASPWKKRPNKLKPQRGDVTPASRPSKIRRPLRPIASRTTATIRKGRRILTPKTRLASKLNAAHLDAAIAAGRQPSSTAPPHSAPPLTPTASNL